MLQSDLSMYVSKKFLHYGLLQDDDVDVMAYYLENIISSGLVVFSVIGIAFLTGLYQESVLYFCTFFLGRHCCGGYHARTHLRCYVLSMGTYLLFLLLTIGFAKVGEPFAAVTFMVVAANLFIFIFAPADSENKRFTKKEKRLYRRNSLLFLAGIDLLYLGCLTDICMGSFFSVFFAVLQLAVSVAIVKLLERRSNSKT